MSTASRLGPGRWGFLKDFPPPSPSLQRELVLECAAARTLYRVALLRAPVASPPLRDQLRALHVRVRYPVSARRLVPVALALWKEDPDGVACDAALEWYRAEGNFAVFVLYVDRARTRWLRARAALVSANLRLGAAIVRKLFFYSQMPQEDLLQEASFGLARAADRFDPNFGVKFSTYATWWIRHAAQRAIHNTMRVVRLPAHVCDHISRYAAARHELGADADEKALAERTNLPLPKLRKIAHLYATQGMGPKSFDAPISALDSEVPLVEQFEDTAFQIEDEIQRHQEKAQVLRVLEGLSPRSRMILEHRFGLGDSADQTLREIGKDLALSRERVRQVEKKALKDLAGRLHPTLCAPSR